MREMILSTVKVQNILFHAPTRAKGSPMIVHNVEVDGKPFGQIWTFKARGEVHPFHAKTLAGAYQTFATIDAAREFVRLEA